MSLPSGPLVVEIAKVADYLLGRTHPTGRAKAAFFEAFGFVADDPLGLASALTRHGRERPVTDMRSNPYGLSHGIRRSLRPPDGRDPCVVSVWFRSSGDRTLRLVTAYPAS